MIKRELTKRQTKILNLWNSGKHTYETIGKEFNVSRERIRQILRTIKRKGHEIISTKEASKGRRKHETGLLYEALKHKFIDLYNNDLSTQKISEELAISISISKAIEKRLIDEGLIRKIYYRKNASGLSEDKKRERWIKIRNYRKENKTLEEIGMLMSLSKPTIANTIREMKNAGWNVPNSKDDKIYQSVRLSPEEIDRRKAFILEGIFNGQSRKKLGEELGLDGGAVSRFIKKYLADEL